MKGSQTKDKVELDVLTQCKKYTKVYAHICTAFNKSVD